MAVGTDGQNEFYSVAAYFRPTQAVAPVDDGAGGQQMVLKDVKQIKMPRIAGGGTKIAVTNRTVGSPKFEKASGIIGLVDLIKIVKDGAEGFINVFDAEDEQIQRAAYYSATKFVDAAIGSGKGALRSDLINYVVDGTLPAAPNNMTSDQKSNFNKYISGVIKTGNSILQNNKIPVQENSNIQSEKR